MGKHQGRAARSACMIHRMRIERFRLQRNREKRIDIDVYKALVDNLPEQITDRQRADAQAALAIDPQDPQGKLL